MDPVRVFEASEHKITRLNFETPVGVRHINLYVVEYRTNGKTFLVDTGPKGKRMHESLCSLLEQECYPLESLDALFLTHEHLDHWGGTRELQERHPGLRLVTHPKTYDVMTLLGSRNNPMFDHMEPLAEAGVPYFWERVVRLFYERRFLRKYADAIKPGDVTQIQEGPLEEFGINVRHLPGHSEAHLGIEVGPYLICGDVLWQGKTPNPFFSNGNPHLGVQAYLDTMDLVMGRAPGYDMALPAHGEVITDIVGYTRFIHDHHHKRWDRLKGTLDRPKTPWQVLMDSGIVRGQRRIHPAHLMLATSEVIGHLEWAEDNGWAGSYIQDGLRYYFLN